MWEVWWSLPGPRRFVDRVVTALQTGRDVAILLPDRAPSGLYAAVHGALRAKSDAARLRRIELSETRAQRPAERIYQALFGQPTGEDRVTADYVARQMAEPPLHCWLSFEGDDWDAWRSFLELHAEAGRQMPETGRGALAITVSGAASLAPPQSGPTLAVCAWRDYVRRFDMRLFIHELWSCRPNHDWHDEIWEAVISEFAGADPLLAMDLCRLPIAELSDAERILSMLHRGLVPGADGAAIASQPDERWAQGLGDTLDGRPFVHSLVLARDEPNALQRRVWKGQIRELMPRLEECREELLPYFRRCFPKETAELTLCEFNDLLEMQEELGARADRTVTNRLRTLREVRNKLAHFEPVPSELVCHRHLRVQA